MYKKRDARAKLLFYFNKPIGFLDVLVTVASLNLKVPIKFWLENAIAVVILLLPVLVF